MIACEKVAKLDKMYAEILKVRIYKYILVDFRSAETLMASTIKKNPFEMAMYFEYWSHLKEYSSYKNMLKLCERMVKNSENAYVPTG